jgi:hypothetical protein
LKVLSAGGTDTLQQSSITVAGTFGNVFFSEPFYESLIQSVVSQDSYMDGGLNHEAHNMINTHDEYAQTYCNFNNTSVS